MNFSLSKEQKEILDKWLREEVYPEVVEKQMADTLHPTPFHYDCWERGYPYEGAIGGALTYCFTTTSLGTVVKVKYGTDVLDLTDYDSW